MHLINGNFSNRKLYGFKKMYSKINAIKNVHEINPYRVVRVKEEKKGL